MNKSPPGYSVSDCWMPKQSSARKPHSPTCRHYCTFWDLRTWYRFSGANREFPRYLQELPGVGEVKVQGTTADAYADRGGSLVPEVVAAVSMPIIMELITNEIEDRLLAPLETKWFAVEKLVAGAVQSLFAGSVVLPAAAGIGSHSALRIAIYHLT
jgi:hypothetical protein